MGVRGATRTPIYTAPHSSRLVFSVHSSLKKFVVNSDEVFHDNQEDILNGSKRKRDEHPRTQGA